MYCQNKLHLQKLRKRHRLFLRMHIIIPGNLIALFCLLHSFDRHSQVGIKFDWYDPNTLVKEKEIGNDNGTTATDIKYNTPGIGYIYYFDANFKLVTWYDFVKNESTLVPGYTSDLKDDVFTLRLQFRF